MSIDGAKPLLAVSFTLDSPLLIIPVTSQQCRCSVAADKVVRHERRDYMLVTLRVLPLMLATAAIRMARSESNGCQRYDARCIDHHDAGAAAR